MVDKDKIGKTNTIATVAPPLNVEIELSACCQLSCPFCRTGGLRAAYRGRVKKGYMAKETMAALLDKVPISFAYLYNWGEPLLNPNVVELTSDVVSRGIRCELGTNLQFLPEGMAEGLMGADPGSIRVSCDGMTQETYGRYRMGGDLAKLLANAERLAAAKQRTRAETRIIFQMVVNRWNHHEIDQFDSFAKAHGADSSAIVGLCALTPEGWHAHPEWKCGDPKYSYLGVGTVKSCGAPEDRLSFNWNGDVYNCCNPVGLERYSLGNIVKAESLDEIWKSPKMEYVRRFCRTGKPEQGPHDIPCYRCFGVFPSEERKRSDEYYSCFAAMEEKNDG